MDMTNSMMLGTIVRADVVTLKATCVDLPSNLRVGIDGNMSVICMPGGLTVMI